MGGDDRPGEIDLGLDHFMRWSVWSPDRELNPQYDGIPDIDPVGITIRHKLTEEQRFKIRADYPGYAEDGWCHGALLFDLPNVGDRLFVGHPVWQVESLDPLTISPSILCQCGDHGFIKQGRWTYTA